MHHTFGNLTWGVAQLRNPWVLRGRMQHCIPPFENHQACIASSSNAQSAEEAFIPFECACVSQLDFYVVICWWLNLY